MRPMAEWPRRLASSIRSGTFSHNGRRELTLLGLFAVAGMQLFDFRGHLIGEV
jgi:hypothetical protein